MGLGAIGVPQTRDTSLGVPHTKDCKILGSILGSPYLRETTKWVMGLGAMCLLGNLAWVSTCIVYTWANMGTTLGSKNIRSTYIDLL